MEVAILAYCKRYSRKTKVTEVEIAEADSVAFVDFMENLYTKPGKAKWKEAFNKEVSPHLENLERQIQSAIDVMTECKEQRAKLQNSPSAPELTMLKKMCTNHTAKLTSLRNTMIPQITIELLKAVDKMNVKDPDNFILKRR